ncbi:hypothetical protein E4U34_007934 [Claviceps purpurea]|nr:hypothetical protein E4U34_007934 [Claviceps purpurea]
MADRALTPIGIYHPQSSKSNRPQIIHRYLMFQNKTTRHQIDLRALVSNGLTGLKVKNLLGLISNMYTNRNAEELLPSTMLAEEISVVSTGGRDGIEIS